MADSLEGKACLVTGAAGGLGKAIAQAFLAAGAKVVLCDINAGRLKDTTDEFSTSYPDKVVALQADITNESAVEKLFEEALDKTHRLDVLVNNAGLMDKFDPVGTLEKQEWDRILAVNLTAPYLMTKAAVNQMLAQEPAGGTVINVASSASMAGFRAGQYT